MVHYAGRVALDLRTTLRAHIRIWYISKYIAIVKYVTSTRKLSILVFVEQILTMRVFPI